MINLCFHGIGEPQRTLEPGEGRYWISRSSYLAVLDEISTWGQVGVSFDDGNESDVRLALEPLVERGLTASFFVVAGRLGRRGSLDGDDLGELRRQGMVVGTHGMAHRPWTGLGPDALGVELVEARTTIEAALGAPIATAALPLGRYDRQVLRALRAAGYAQVYSSDRAPARTGAWLQPRYSVTADDTSTSLREQVLHRQGRVDRLYGALNQLRKRFR